jgi:hypothetical protein
LKSLHLPAKPITPPEDPYIYTPYVTKTIPEPVNITSYIPEYEVREGFKIKFPPKLEIYDRTEVGGCYQ